MRGQQIAAYVLAAVWLKHVQRDDVCARPLELRQNEAEMLFAVECHQAVRPGQTQKPSQHAFRIGDAGRVAGLVNFVEGVEVLGLVRSQTDFHGAYTSRMTGRIKGRLEVCFFR